MATMEDIAGKLGISKGTVSKALSGATDISEAMRRTVLETAVEMGYTRVTRANTARRVCVFIEHTAYEKPEDFGWDLILGFRKMAEPNGYSVDIVPLDITLQNEIPYDEFMMQHNYLGGFFIGINYLDPWLQGFSTGKTPAVLFDNCVQSPYTVHVGINNDEGIDLAIQELRQLGHKTIGYLSASLGSYVFQERYSSFFRSLRKNEMNDDPDLAGHSYFSTECIQLHLPRLLEKHCTAVICSHDLLAQTLLIHCMDRGIRVPEDLSIIGIDDLPICQYTTPTLTSIRQDREELGKSAFYALSCQIDQIHIDTLTLHPELIVRGSIGPAPFAETE